MEDPNQRKKYLTFYEKIYDLVELNDKFLALLNSHQTFGSFMNTLEDRSNDRKKDFILLELTRTRASCNEIIEFLEKSGQSGAAERLKDYNKPVPLEKYSFEIEIPVSVSDAMSRMEGSFPYDMTRKPRGKALIVNNVSEELSLESKRFEHIFKELLFDVEIVNGLTATGMAQKFYDSSLIDPREQQSQAIIIMVITHGMNEKVLGSKACKALETLRQINQGEPDEELKLKCLYDIRDDQVDISYLVDIYSDSKRPHLKNIPKMFFFTCCREKFDILDSIGIIQTSLSELKTNENEQKCSGQTETDIPYELQDKKLKSVESKSDNKDTFICFSCAEGYETVFKNGISFFGQALSHAIAKYANQLDLNAILVRTIQLLGNINGSGHFAPELRLKCLNNQMYFNPGWFKE